MEKIDSLNKLPLQSRLLTVNTQRLEKATVIAAPSIKWGKHKTCNMLKLKIM